MKNVWKTLPFEDCIEKVTYTQKIKRKDFLDEGTYPVVSQEEEFINGYWNDKADLFKVTRPVVVFGDHTKVLKYVDFDFVLGADGVKILQPREGVLPRFFYYQLHTANLDSLGYARHYKLLKELEITYPTLTEQRRIVGILDEVFAGIATAKANAEKNLQNARAILKGILSDATRGKLTADRRMFTKTNPASTTLQQRLKQRRSQWNGKGKYKEPKAPVSNKLVTIPENWTLASPEHVTTHIVDCPHSTPKWTETGVVCLRTTNFQSGFLDLESVRFVSEATYRERSTKLEPKPGDVLYSREGGILGIACILPDNLRACLGQRMMLFRLDTSLCLPKYFVAVMNSSLILSEVKRLTGGAASPHLNIRDIKRFPIPLPPIKEQHDIVRCLDAVSTKTRYLESIYQRKLVALDELKKSLLHQAFSGQL